LDAIIPRFRVAAITTFVLLPGREAASALRFTGALVAIASVKSPAWGEDGTLGTCSSKTLPSPVTPGGGPCAVNSSAAVPVHRSAAKQTKVLSLFMAVLLFELPVALLPSVSEA